MTNPHWTLDRDEEEINLTPLLDCIFILVFFFLVATTLREEEARLEVNLPDVPVEAAAPARDTLEIVITEDGQIVVDGEVAQANDLRRTIRSALGQHPGHRVVVRGDAQSRLEAFALVVAALSHLGVPDFDLLTEPATTADSQP